MLIGGDTLVSEPASVSFSFIINGAREKLFLALWSIKVPSRLYRIWFYGASAVVGKAWASFVTRANFCL